MEKYQVTMIGGKPPKRPKGLLAALRRLVAAALTALPIGAITIVLAGGIGFVSFIGTPHIGWDYGCSHATRGIGICRAASWCSYYGMLTYLKARGKEAHAVIIGDISRLARGLMAHFELRVKISDAGGVLVSPSIEFGEDSDSQLVENLLASVSQHQRQKNGEQTINRMRARVQNGYWVFQAPVGYRYERVSGHRKLLVRDEPISADFPLRGFVLCNDCGKPLTACWSQGKNQKYPYYLCPTKGCASYRKSIKRDKLEGAFESMLERLQPSKGFFALAKAMFRDAWDTRLTQTVGQAKELKAGVRQLEKQIEQLLDRIMDATSDSVVSAYEKRITKLDREKLVLQEQLAESGKPRHTFEESFEHAMRFLASHWSIWINSDLAFKKPSLDWPL